MDHDKKDEELDENDLLEVVGGKKSTLISGEIQTVTAATELRQADLQQPTQDVPSGTSPK
jgi:hypothetical protein